MEIAEIEQLMKKCSTGDILLSEKGDTFNIIAEIVALRCQKMKFCKERWDFLASSGYDMEKAYCETVKDTQENTLAGFAILLFSLANKYKANIRNLRLEADHNNQTIENLMYSMIKIVMTHYKPYKKVVILIGMICGYCISNEIDLVWFVKNRIRMEGYNIK